MRVRNASPGHQVDQPVTLWISGCKPPDKEVVVVYNVKAVVVGRELQGDKWKMTYRILEGISFDPDIRGAVVPKDKEIPAYPRARPTP